MKRIRRLDLRTHVTAHVTELLLEAEPGSRLPTEGELSRQLGVSRSTVREAIRMLALLGVISVRHGEGLYAGDLKHGTFTLLTEMAIVFRHPTFQEVVEARRMIEVDTAALAAARRYDEDLRTLREIMHRMARHLDNPRRASIADLEFHIALAQASHNGVLVYLINTMRGLLGLWVHKAFSDRRIEIPEIVREHNAVLAAVEEGDSKAASDLMGRHIDEASRRLFRVIAPNEPLSRYARSLLLSRDGLVEED